jgi:peptidoglycan hydrolase-like protein with peptidoglycan-binding domain
MANLEWPLLVEEDEGDDVTAAQYLLWCAGASGFDPDGPDGVFGEITKDAVMWFQRKAHLTPVDGKIGKDAWTKMTDGTTIPDSLLEYGSTGHCVGAAQVELRKHRLYQGMIDGDYREKTQNAVRNFQQKVGIPNNGNVDKVTWQNLICRSSI